MFEIWFRTRGDNASNMPHHLCIRGIAAANLAWDALALHFEMMSARPAKPPTR